MGRAWKQIFFNSKGKTSDVAKQALVKSFNEYKTAYDRGGGEWAGLNLLALATFASQHGIPIAERFDIGRVAEALLQSLDAYAQDKQDNWYHASKAEACLGLNDLTRRRAAYRRLCAERRHHRIRSCRHPPPIHRFVAARHAKRSRTRDHSGPARCATPGDPAVCSI